MSITNWPLLCNALLLLVCTIYFLVIVSHFETRIGDEFVILGNDALMKCQAPSFVSDFLSVTGWVDERLQNLKSSAKGKIWGNHWREKMMMIMALEWYSSNLLREANFGKQLKSKREWFYANKLLVCPISYTYCTFRDWFNTCLFYCFEKIGFMSCCFAISLFLTSKKNELEKVIKHGTRM